MFPNMKMRRGDIADEAERLALKFLGTIAKIREYVDTDVQAAFDGDPAAFFR